MSGKEGAPPRLVRVVAALCTREDRFLITQRPDRGSFASYWEFPGGKVEEGEEDEAALAREMIEELGVVVRVGALYQAAVHAYPTFVIDFRVYRCTLLEGEFRAVEVQDLRWICPSEIGEFLFPPADVPVLERLRREGVGEVG